MQLKHVAVIDADELSRYGLQNMLRAIPDLDSPHLYPTVRDFDDSINTQPVNIILLNDDAAHTVDVADLVTRWLDRLYNVQIVIVSKNVSVRYIQRLFASGARGFIHRPECTQSTVAACLETLRRHENYISPAASAQMYKRTADAEAVGLLETDLDVLHLINEGLRTQEIAFILKMHERSIHRSRSRLRAALGVQTNEQLVPAGIRHGLLEVDV